MRRFAVASLGLHAALLAGLVGWFQPGGPIGDAPDKEAAVELIMVEKRGEPVTSPTEPAADTAQSLETEPSPPRPADTAEADEELPVPPPQPPPMRPVQPAPPSVLRPRAAPPPVQLAVQAPDIRLDGTSDRNAIATAMGPSLIPASVDARFRNRQPVYPLEAVRRSEQGAVTLVIHVSAEGLANRVDVLESSGHTLLDRSARDAVAAWRFLPAVKDGQPVPFEMPLRVVFQLE